MLGVFYCAHCSHYNYIDFEQEGNCRCILLHHALHKRRAYLDSFASGLDVMGVKEMIVLFPHKMKQLFVSDGVVNTNKVGNLLRPNPPIMKMNGPQLRVWRYLLAFINQADEQGTL